MLGQGGLVKKFEAVQQESDKWDRYGNHVIKIKEARFPVKTYQDKQRKKQSQPHRNSQAGRKPVNSRD